MIEALDDDGYLSSPLEELLETLPPEYEIELEELEIALRHIQNFDPTGIGARSPQECLALQLRAQAPCAEQELALAIVDKHLELLAARDFARIKRLTGCDDAALRAAHALITSLDPRPGARFAALETRYITPDVIVKKIKGKWTAYINPDAYPRLRINRLYAEILAKQRRGNGNLTGQLQEARWLIKNVQQRFETIHRVTQAIVDRQRQFFEHGEVAMRPLVLREIADILGLHESTVSRVTSQKYMATPRGIFELKYFFGSHVATDTGGACSATAIRALIKQLIGSEDGKKPLSDSQISEILGQQGIVVARRTVAKYREALNIPPVNLRKTL
jgi:RNA polymerase sigma-54 factor